MSTSNSDFDMKWFCDFLSLRVIGEMGKNRERDTFFGEGETYWVFVQRGEQWWGVSGARSPHALAYCIQWHQLPLTQMHGPSQFADCARHSFSFGSAGGGGEVSGKIPSRDILEKQRALLTKGLQVVLSLGQPPDCPQGGGGKKRRTSVSI